jgi:hypothetical protein
MLRHIRSLSILVVCLTIWIGDSTISGSLAVGFVSGGGASASYGTNKVNGNANDGAATTSAAMK